MKNVIVRLTDHFLERLYERRDESGFSGSKFFTVLPALVRAAKQHPGRDCLVIVGGAKLIFSVTKIGEDRYMASFVTVMPKAFKHSISSVIGTVNLGEIVP